MALLQSSTGKCSFVNLEGKIISRQFQDACEFQGELAAVCNREKWGFIDTSGALVIPHQFDSVHFFYEGYCVVEKDDLYGVINPKGEWVLRNNYHF